MARLPWCSRENAMAPGSGRVARTDTAGPGIRTAASSRTAGRNSRTTMELPGRTTLLPHSAWKETSYLSAGAGLSQARRAELHVGDELLHALVDGPERVLAEH